MSAALQEIHELQQKLAETRKQNNLLKRKVQRRDARLRVLCQRIFELERKRR